MLSSSCHKMYLTGKWFILKIHRHTHIQNF